jgi:HK97 family phage portal protein
VRSLVGELVAAVRGAKTAAEPPVPLTSGRNLTGNLFGQSTGGSAVRNMAAMGSVGTLFAIVDLLATSTASARWRLWRPAASGDPDDRTEVRAHAALDTWNRPNKFYSGLRLREAGQQHIDLTGEGWILTSTSPAMPGVPLGLWLVRPDRITPVPSATDYLAGYIYHGPDGEKIPLGVDQVMGIQIPNPLDEYRGMGAVGAILADAESIAAAVAWNRNFFSNGAEPGGIIEVPDRLGETAFNELRARWQEQHRGISNAHRVAILEQGKWVDRKFSHDDMQFAELRKVSRDAIREAFRIHGHMLGDADDVNLANATAAEITFARRQAVPRLDRWRELLNTQYLPKFGQAAAGLEFDYDSPVAEDEAQDAEIFYNRARGAQMLVLAGYSGKDVAAAARLPEMEWDPATVTRSSSTIAAETAGGGRPPADESNWDNRLPSGGGRPALPAGGGPKG